MAVMNLLVVIAAAMVAVPSVLGHGMIHKPLARQACNDDVSSTYHVYFGTSSGNIAGTLGGLPGFCGDPFTVRKGDYVESNFKGMPCEPQEAYEEGGILDLTIHITGNHGGFFMAAICESTDLSDECFNKHQLLTVEHNSDRWYILEGNKLTDKRDGAESFHTSEWKLPEGLTCDHCVLMWTWATAHQCAIKDCDPKVCGFYAEGRNYVFRPDEDRVWPECPNGMNPSPGQIPQMYRNCADIKIEARSGSETPPLSPKEPTPASPKVTPEAEGGEFALCVQGETKWFGPELKESRPAGVYISPSGQCEWGEYSGGFDGFPSKNIDDGHEKEMDEAIKQMFPGNLSKQTNFLREMISIAQPVNLDPATDREIADGGGRMSNIDLLSDACSELVSIDCDGDGARSASTEFEETDETLSLEPEGPTPKEAPTAEEEQAPGIIENVSGAGNDLTCDDELVQKVLWDLNRKRGRRNINKVQCDDRATGAAANWAGLQCNEKDLHDDSIDNCNLSNFGAGCTELDAISDEEGPFDGIDWPTKKALYRNSKLTHVGIGYHECDGDWYWTLLGDAPTSV